MAIHGAVPDHPLDFIRRCVEARRILWTHHVNMRLGQRAIRRDTILGAVQSYEMIEAYPDDKYLPSYLVRAVFEGVVVHILFAADVESGHVRVVTAYHPQPDRWDPQFRTRRRP